MLRHVPDQQVDAIRCEALSEETPEYPLCLCSGIDDDVIKPLLALQISSHLRFFAECLATAEGAAYDGWGLAYDSDEPWPGAEPFEGIKVFVPWGEVVVGREAFERLMARWYAAIIEAVSLQRLAVVGEPWWAEFTDHVAALRARVAARGERPA